jgi:hypothetical protein
MMPLWAAVLLELAATAVGLWLERVSKIGSASDQVLTSEAGERVSFCHEETAEAVDGRAVGAD